MIEKLPNQVLFETREDTSDKEAIEDIWYTKEYNLKGFEIEKDGIIIDIGAHIGVFTVYAAKLAKKGKVYSFEPHPENFILLQKNCELNKVKNIELFKYGVYKKEGKGKLFIDEKYNACHSLYKKSQKSVIIDCTTLKAIFDINKIEFCDFLKIDCEGAEYDILLNTPVYYFDKIDKIALEYHDSIYKGKRWYHLVNFLSERGFKVTTKPFSSSRGIFYAKNIRKKNSLIIKLENYLNTYTPIILKDWENYLNKCARVISVNFDRTLGFTGIFLKKHCPGLYFELKRIQNIKNISAKK